MFFPGETISHNFIIPFINTDIDHVVVSYKDGDDVFLEKTVTSGFAAHETDKTFFSITFTQTESLLFPDDMQYTIQCNVLTNGGSRHTSRLIKGKTGEQHLREVMNGG